MNQFRVPAAGVTREQMLAWAAARHEPGALTEIRAAAGAIFDEISWPAPTEEEWRRTDLSELDLDGYELEMTAGKNAGTSGPSAGRARPADMGSNGGMAASAVVRFHGDRVHEMRVGRHATSDGLVIVPFPDSVGGLTGSIPGQASGLMKASASAADNRIVAWHYYLLTHGAFVVIPAGMSLDKPVVIAFEGHENGRFYAPHLTVVVGDNSRATIVVTGRLSAEQNGSASGSALTLYGLDMHVGKNAEIDYASVLEPGANSVVFRNDRVVIERDARVTTFDAHLGGRMDKSRLTADIVGSGVDAELNGIFFARGEEHVDVRTVQRHVGPSSSSRSSYRGAAGELGRSVFQGMIEVAPAAGGTDAYLSNKNLVLNDGARADSIPSLQIKTNDVKCSHGSTTSRIDEDQVYYLMTRGIPRNEAVSTLIEGFFEETIRRAPDAAADKMRKIVGTRIAETAPAATAATVST